MAKFDLLVIGEPMVEFNMQTNGQVQLGIGGDALHVVVAANRAGIQSALVSQLGDDEFGAMIADFMQTEGLSDEFCPKIPKTDTGIYFIHKKPDGHYFSYRRKNSAASLIQPDFITPELIASAKIIHASGIGLAISDSSFATINKAFDMAKLQGVMTSFDINYRPRLWDKATAIPKISEIMAKADYLFPSIEDGHLLWGIDDLSQIADNFLQYNPKILALTLGKDGVFMANGQEKFTIRPPKVKTIDTTGAGDCFTGSFLSIYQQTTDIHCATEIAVKAAARSTESWGGINSYPLRQEYKGFTIS